MTTGSIASLLPFTRRGRVVDLLQPISSALLAPPLQFLTPFLQPELLEGRGNLPRWLLADNGFRHGAVFTLHTVPPGLSRTAQLHPVWRLPLATIYYKAFLRNEGEVTSRTDEMHTDELVWLADNLGGPRVEYDVLPGVILAWSYLIWTG